MPGVTVEDMGHKMGLNGVDNAKLSFDNVRVPRENLLNKYSDVSPDGVFRYVKNGATTLSMTTLSITMHTSGERDI
jgi:alkylation response protein AidB-like acyl-CoA dehydrogenase